MIESLIEKSAPEKILEKDFMDECKKYYEENGTFNVPSIVNKDLFNKYLYDYYKANKSILKEKACKHHTVDDEGRIYPAGFSFYRLSMRSRCIGPENQQKCVELYKEFKLLELANCLHSVTGKLINYCSGKNMRLVDVKCFIYEEGDYIGIHNDQHHGHHVNFQFPVNINTRGVFRYMQDGLMKLNYDQDGGAKALCGDIWHDVPPIARLNTEQDPVRIVYMLVYKP